MYTLHYSLGAGASASAAGLRYAENNAKRANMRVRKTCLLSVEDRLRVARDATASTTDIQHHNFDLDITPITDASIAPRG
jgi:hypothetical protein